MEKAKVTLEDLHTSITICQLAIQQAKDAGESPQLYEMLASSYINGHLENQYEVIN